MKIITLIISIILIYLVIVTFMYLNQRKLLYLPSENNYLDDEIQFDFKEVFIEVESDLKLKSWIIEKLTLVGYCQPSSLDSLGLCWVCLHRWLQSA